MKNVVRAKVLGTRLAVTAVAVLLTAPSAHAQSVARYRDYQLGASVASTAAAAGMKVSDAKLVHERPAVMQDLQWRAPFALSDATAKATDPVEQIVFSFYNDQLFRLVIDYDRHRTDGLTDADMIEAISAVYGAKLQPPNLKERRTISLIATDSGSLIATWGDADYSAGLYRSPYGSGFRMIVAATRLNALAQVAADEAVRLDEREAPQLAIDREKREQADLRVAQEKARLSNKSAFRP